MFLKLPSSWVDTRTQTSLPDAVLVISDTEFSMRRGDTRVTAAIYANAAAVGAAQPVEEFPIALSTGERDTQMPALLGALYTVLLARPEYAGSELVT